MLKILNSHIYVSKSSTDNETMFHLLQVATADGNAAHIVDKYKEERDGQSAFQELIKWEECDELTTETVGDVQDTSYPLLSRHG